MSGYESDEFEKMSDDESPEKPQSKTTSSNPAATFQSALQQQQQLNVSGGVVSNKNGGNLSPTSMSAFAESLANTGQSSTLRPALNAFNFESLEPGRLSQHNSTGNLLANPNSGTFTPPATTVGKAPPSSAEANKAGYVAPTPAMDSAEEAIAKVLEGKIWRKQYDAAQKKYYYYHTVTRQTTWDLAKELGFGTPAAAGSSLKSPTNQGSKAPLATSLQQDPKTAGLGHRDSSDASVASALPPDPLLSRGGPGYRYSGFVAGGGFADSASNPSNRQSLVGPFGRADSIEMAGGGGNAFGDYDGFVAFGRGGTPSASASQSATPRRIAVDVASNAPFHHKSVTLVGSGGGDSTRITPIPNLNAAANRQTSVHSVPSLHLKDSAAVAATAAAFGEGSLEEAKPTAAASAPTTSLASQEAKPVGTTAATTTAKKTADSDEESSAFSTLSGAAAKAAAEAKAKADAQIAIEKSRLETQRQQQAKDAAEAMAKFAVARGGGVSTPPPTSGLTGTVGSQLVSPLAGTLGPNGIHLSGAATAPPSLPLAATTAVPPLAGVASPTFAAMNASPVMPMSGTQYPTSGANSLRSPMLLSGAAGSPTLQQQMHYQQQQQTLQSGAAESGKTELLQTAEALEKLVKAFVVLKNGDMPTQTSADPSLRKAASAAHADATDYDTLLRAARYKHVAESASQNVLTSHMVPTRGRYLMDTEQRQPTSVQTIGIAKPIVPTGMGPLAAYEYAQRCGEAAAKEDSTRHLEEEILDTIIAMMTADEGRSMWLHAGSKVAVAATGNAIIPNGNYKEAQVAKKARREPLIDVVSIDQYRSYTREGDNTGRGPISTNPAGFGQAAGRLNTIPSASRFHVEAFDNLTGAFVPGVDTPLVPTPSYVPTPLGNLLEENLEKYLLKHVQAVRGRGVLPASALLPNGEVMPCLTPHLARMILLDLLRVSIDVVITRFSTTTASTVPVNGRDPIIVIYEGPLGRPTMGSSSSTSAAFSPARFLIEACKRTIQSLPFELLNVEGSNANSNELKKPRFRLEHWVTKPHMFSIIHALQWTIRKLERRSNDPYADFFEASHNGTDMNKTLAPSSQNSNFGNEVHVAELDSEWSRVYASELPFFSLAPAQFLSTAKRSGNTVSETINSDEVAPESEQTSAAQTERELLQILQGQVPLSARDKSKVFPRTAAGPTANPLHTRDYFGLDADHLEVMAYAASSIGLDVFRTISTSNKNEAETKPLADVTNATASTLNAAAQSTAADAKIVGGAAAGNPSQKEPPALPLAIKQEIALQCTVACIEELLGDAKILESIKRRATNKANALIDERDKKWRERYESGQKALKSGADFVELEAKRRREEVAAAEKRIGLMVDRMKEEINRQV